MPSLLFDHIVIAVPNLHAAIEHFKTSLGITPLLGGRHVGRGTHNALLGLGKPEDHSYLELIAIDPDDKTHYDSYPLGLTPALDEMYIVTWCLRCSESTDLKIINEQMRKMGPNYDQGNVHSIQRATPSGAILSMQITNNIEQITTTAGQIPFLLKWDDLTQHPTTQFSSNDFLDYSLDFCGPDCLQIEKNLQRLGFVKPESINFLTAPVASIRLTLNHQGKIKNFSSRVKI